jgi:hypothetical protein
VRGTTLRLAKPHLDIGLFTNDIEPQLDFWAGTVVRDPVSYAGVARFGFVTDPDGNWIEISARTSLTGIPVG